MANVSVLGTGRMGKGLVKVLSPYMSEIRWGSRSVERAAKLIEENNYKNVQAVTYEEALDSEVIFHFGNGLGNIGCRRIAKNTARYDCGGSFQKYILYVSFRLFGMDE
ncbi:NAD(P)-binding domain-containing protein [Effusibacillus dendaii]|uniref:Pyrroline-5-carboxylate reductase catalytic N-terminal domain-containing protein n=1 Tax=Effusibacillus dendaii TaxID=2743772 RepID=A0A7I8DFB4_9BACL|nr:NAD(P)-binding domain-containing protein [Effusibacillus dendaii]BCJ87992.1 hypothetical protein skT53_29770 [Effusibacillus dendaii]